MDWLEEELEEFQLYLKKKGASRNTIMAYRSAVRQYYQYCPEIRVEWLRDYKQQLLAQYCPRTVNTKIYGLNSYLRYRLACGKWTETPDVPDEMLLEGYQVKAVKQQQKSFQDNVISNEDYERLKNGLKRDHDDFWYFVVRFLGATGARVSELIQIKAEHLRLGYMDLYSKGGKIRRIYFPDSLCEEGLSWLAQKGVESGFLFVNRSGQQITSRGVRWQLKQLALRYGIDPETVYPHSFRHLYAKNFLAKFNDISLLADLLGHESIETTKIYLTQSSSEQKRLIDRVVIW